ncbi:MAG: DNA-binding protein [Clostridiales bacterium]|jgi:RNA polymerase sigma factor (sigma-70 family)|nr:DNA-binding protein [Clostridiales bacterium]
MDDVLELTMLYDFYGELLTSKQRKVFEQYYMNDYSLNEVAENCSVSRQAVSELLARVKRRLRDYEKKVGFVAFYNSKERP